MNWRIYLFYELPDRNIIMFQPSYTIVVLSGATIMFKGFWELTTKEPTALASLATPIRMDWTICLVFLSFQRILTSQGEYDVSCPERPQFGKYDLHMLDIRSGSMTSTCPSGLQSPVSDRALTRGLCAMIGKAQPESRRFAEACGELPDENIVMREMLFQPTSSGQRIPRRFFPYCFECDVDTRRVLYVMLLRSFFPTLYLRDCLERCLQNKNKAYFPRVLSFASPFLCLHVGGSSNCQRDGSREEAAATTQTVASARTPERRHGLPESAHHAAHEDRGWPGPGSGYETQPELFGLFDEEPGGSRPDPPRWQAVRTGTATHRGTGFRDLRAGAVSRFSCAADGRTAGGRPPMRFCLLLPSRLSACPRSSSRTSRREHRFANRSWRNSWWKCQQSLFSSSRPLTFQFRVVVVEENFKVLFQDRVQQPRIVKIFKVFPQDRVSVEVFVFEVFIQDLWSVSAGCASWSRTTLRSWVWWRLSPTWIVLFSDSWKSGHYFCEPCTCEHQPSSSCVSLRLLQEEFLR